MSTKITLRGNPVTVDGDLPAAGAKAPDFKLTNATLADLRGLGLQEVAAATTANARAVLPGLIRIH